ncbi:MAG: class 1 fructose-bisphosphatase [Bacteroidetes bacterium]|nr:MAG: class 1 fructose-bisphosphatase [Bacteroidota bacterium]
MTKPSPRGSQALLDTRAVMTLEQFIIEQQERFPYSTGSFSRLIRDISVAAKIINRDVRRAGLVDIFGDSGEINVQGEVQKKLDALAHAEMERALRRGGECVLIGSEEHAEAIPLKTSSESGRYIVLMDPLDGSSNIEVNVSIGTIFSVYHLPESQAEPTLEAALQPGTEQVAAGYVVYGSSTMLVYTTGNGVNGFTLDPSIGEFILSHPNIRTPRQGRIYSVNVGNYRSFDAGLRAYLEWVQEEDPATNRPFTLRYIGSFVSDFHRNLLKGGIYIYPANTRDPEGKLRLMYEANPMAFIVEQAGGRATDGTRRILSKRPEALHQRTPVFIGSEEMVRRVESFLTGRSPG